MPYNARTSNAGTTPQNGHLNAPDLPRIRLQRPRLRPAGRTHLLVRGEGRTGSPARRHPLRRPLRRRSVGAGQHPPHRDRDPDRRGRHRPPRLAPLDGLRLADGVGGVGLVHHHRPRRGAGRGRCRPQRGSHPDRHERRGCQPDRLTPTGAGLRSSPRPTTLPTWSPPQCPPPKSSPC